MSVVANVHEFDILQLVEILSSSTYSTFSRRAPPFRHKLGRRTGKTFDAISCSSGAYSKKK